MSYTRKRGRVSNKNIEGGAFQSPYKDGKLQAPYVKTSSVSGASSTPFTQRARDSLASVRAGAQTVGSRVASGAQAVGSRVASGAQAVGSGAQRFGTTAVSKLSRSSAIAPLPVAGKIKPDNLLVPMVINLEQNKVLLGSNIYPIENGAISDDDRKLIETAYNTYIEKAREQLQGSNPDNEQIKNVVRSIVMEEFKIIIEELLTAENLESVKSFANNAIELGMGDLFYDILCITLSSISNEEKVISIRQAVRDLQYTFSYKESNKQPPISEAEDRLNALTGAPEQGLLDTDANAADIEARLIALNQPPEQGLLETGADVTEMEARLNALNQPPKSSSDTIKLPMAPTDERQDAATPSVDMMGGGARRLKKTRKHRKRSKRKTAHYLRRY